MVKKIKPKYEYPTKSIPYQDVFEGKVRIPKGMEWYTGKDGFRQLVWHPEMPKTEKEKEIVLDFIQRVRSEDFEFLRPRYGDSLREDFFAKVRVGNYISNDDQISPMTISTEWFNGSIARITCIFPLLRGHIYGVGVRKNHNCTYQEMAWNGLELHDNIFVREVYEVHDKEGLEAYCKQTGIELVRNFDSVKSRIPIKRDYN